MLEQAGDLSKMGKAVKNYVNVIKGLSVGLNLVDAGFTITDGVTNSWQMSHTADLIIQGVSVGSSFIPIVGPLISLGLSSGYYFYSNYFQNNHNGLTPTQYYFNR